MMAKRMEDELFGKLVRGWTIENTAIAVLVMALTMGCSKGETAKGDRPLPTTAAATEVASAATTLAPTTARTTAARIAGTPPDFSSMAKYQFNKANVESYCREEWTKRGELDSRMFNYCVGQETKGHAEMLQTLKKFGKQSWMATLFPAIWAEWTKRGVTQYRMVAHGLKGESDKFLDFEYEKKQVGFNAAKMLRCEEEWASHASRWSMTMHCYKND